MTPANPAGSSGASSPWPTLCASSPSSSNPCSQKGSATESHPDHLVRRLGVLHHRLPLPGHRKGGPLRKPHARPTPVQRRYTTNPSTFRSGLEAKTQAQIEAAGQPVHYEQVRIPFIQPSKPRHYTPDFVLRNGVVVETKGLFQTDDRQKHVMVKGQHPAIDIRFVFSNAQAKVSKLSGTTYAMWAEKHGFKWAHRVIPDEWFTEADNVASLEALKALGFISQ